MAGGLCNKFQPLLLSLRTGVCHPCTRTYVKLLGPCFKTGERKPFRHPQPDQSRHAQVNSLYAVPTNPAKRGNAGHSAPAASERGSMTQLTLVSFASFSAISGTL
jgi:hypothetical protein